MPLPLNAPSVVIRHSRHGGGVVGPNRRSFRPDPRADEPLATARCGLSARGVPTPEVVAYAVYPAIWPFARGRRHAQASRGSRSRTWQPGGGRGARGRGSTRSAACFGALAGAGAASRPESEEHSRVIPRRANRPRSFSMWIASSFGAPASADDRHVSALRASSALVAKWPSGHHDSRAHGEPRGHAAPRRREPPHEPRADRSRLHRDDERRRRRGARAAGDQRAQAGESRDAHHVGAPAGPGDARPRAPARGRDRPLRPIGRAGADSSTSGVRCASASSTS